MTEAAATPGTGRTPDTPATVGGTGATSVRCLGRLEVWREGQAVGLGGPRQRLVLAHLLIRANQTVPVDRLIAEVWDDDPPPAARSTLQGYVSHLRKALGADAIVGRGQGYELRVETDQVDRMRFEALAERGRTARATDPAAAAAALREALDLWRGPPFADLHDAASLQPEIVRLSELRMSALEDRIGADLDSGRDQQLIGELEALVAEHPLRERLWGQLMVALYRSGRQGDALTAFERVRSGLADELGVDPSAELRTLHERILRHDPTLRYATVPIKGYRLLERLGEGSFGVTWRATRPGVDRDVVIKVARPARANDPAFIRRFEADAQRVTRIEHPHVAPLYDFWRESDGAYLVRRYLSGGTLGDLLDRAGPTDRATALRVADQITRALAAAHQLGVVHGAITPSNVLLDDDGNAYLADIAIARDTVVRQGVADEHPDGRREPDHATVGMHADVRALGAVLSRLLIDPGGAVGDIVRRATADGDMGYGNAVDLLADLQTAVGGIPTVAPPSDRTDRATRPPRNPYKGLRAFTESDAADFFGRDAVVARLVTRLRDGTAAARFLAVVGPSGSGKSSIVQAGLLPALRAGALDGSEAWYVAQMVPGGRPFDELATALHRVAVDPPDDLADQLAGAGLNATVADILPDDGDLLLVIDQFEELFTLVGDADVRGRFADALVDAVTATESHVRVVVTLRADFYDRPLTHRGLTGLMQACTETVGPLGPDELEQVITGPAEQVGVDVERPLVARMIADVNDQPGALPLLQYALTELFDARQGAMLSAATYRAIGGVTGALSRRAEEVFSRLSDDAQEAGRQLFLRLVTPGEGVEDTRRRTLVADATALAPDAMPAVLTAFGDARLLSFDRDPETRAPTVEVAHEALLREWRRLRRWIDAARDDLRTHRRLQAAATDWITADRDPSFLATGSRLDHYEAWRDGSGITATRTEWEYLDASIQHRDRAVSEEAARRQRERDLERRSVRRLRILVTILAVAALVASGLTVFAVAQGRRAADEAQRAARGERIATARELAAAADANLDVDPERSMLLGIAAIDATRATDGTVLREAEEALHRAVHTSRVTLRVPGVGGQLDWSPDGTMFVTEGPENAGVIDVRDATTGASVLSWEGHGIDVNQVLFSPDGSTLLTTGDDGAVRLWDFEAGALRSEHVQPVNEADDGIIFGSSISPDGSQVAAAWPNTDVLRILDATTGGVITEIEDVGAPFYAFHTAFSSDGREIAVPSWDRSRVVIYDTATGEELRMLEPGPSTSVAWSPDGRWIAVLQEADADAYVFDATTGDQRFILSGHTSDVRSLDWSSDSTRLATSSVDGTVRIWDVTDGGATESLVLSTEGMSSGILGVAFSPDDTLVMAGEEGIARVMAWNVERISGGEWAPLPAGDPGEWTTVVAAGDGRHVVAPGRARAAAMWDPLTAEQVREYGGDEPAATVAVGGDLVAAVNHDNVVTAWDAESGRRRFVVDVNDGGISDMDISADGRFVAVGNLRGPIRIVDSAGTGRAMVDATFGSSTEFEVTAVALNPDASLIAVAEIRHPDNAGRVTVWDVERRATVHTMDARANNLAFSQDGTHIAIAQRDGVATIRDATDGTIVSTLRGHVGPVSNAVFDADGSMVATTGVDGTVRLWDAETGSARLVLPGHDIASLAAVFTGGGDTLTTVGRDGVARTWALDVDDLIAIAEDKLTRTFTDAECREYPHVEMCPGS